ncbi:MAG: Rieske (2Fe-2S) protein [Burkholderiales bacterium]
MAARARLICASSALEEGGKGVRFEVPWAGETMPAFVVRYDGRPVAYLNRCGHVPVELDFNAGEFFDLSGLYFVCATHGALYAPESGACVGGPCAGRGLKRLAVLEREGNVYLIEGNETYE